MEKRQLQRVECYERVQTFLAEHPLTPPASYGEPQRRLDEVLAQITDAATRQEAAERLARAGTVRIEDRCRRFRTLYLLPIVAVAAAVREELPGIEAELRLPDSGIAAIDLVRVAGAMREIVAPHERTFVANGCADGFLARMDAATQELHDLILAREAAAGERAASRARIVEEIRRGRNAVRVLDAIVRREFIDAPGIIRTWMMMRRVHHVRVVRAPSPAAADVPIATGR